MPLMNCAPNIPHGEGNTPIVKGSTKAKPPLTKIRDRESSIFLLKGLRVSQPIRSRQAVTKVPMRMPPKTSGKVESLYDVAIMSKGSAILRVKTASPAIAKFIRSLYLVRRTAFRKKLITPKPKMIMAEIVK